MSIETKTGLVKHLGQIAHELLAERLGPAAQEKPRR